MLDQVARDPSHVVCPCIGKIETETLAVNFKDVTQYVGGFDWQLTVRIVFTPLVVVVVVVFLRPPVLLSCVWEGLS